MSTYSKFCSDRTKLNAVFVKTCIFLHQTVPYLNYSFNRYGTEEKKINLSFTEDNLTLVQVVPD
jgi:hypothetical protein